MKTRMFEEGGYTFVENDCIKGWHKCEPGEFFAGMPPYAGELDNNMLKWVGAKIPKEIILKTAALASKFPTTEIMVCLYYNPTQKQWQAHVPKQKGTPAHVSYSDEDWKTPKGWAFLGTIHTHPNMAAFWSGTDTTDQTLKDGLHVVLGLTAGKITSYKCSLFYNKKRYDQEDAVEMPTEEEAVPEVDEEWLNRVEIEYSPVTVPVQQQGNSLAEYVYYGHVEDSCSLGETPEDDFVLDVLAGLYAYPVDTAYALVQEILQTIGETDLVDRVGEARLEAAQNE